MMEEFPCDRETRQLFNGNRWPLVSQDGPKDYRTWNILVDVTRLIVFWLRQGQAQLLWSRRSESEVAYHSDAHREAGIFRKLQNSPQSVETWLMGSRIEHH